MNAPLPITEPERLQALLDYEILDTESEDCFDDLTRLASHICGTPIALISLIDADRQWFKSRVGVDARETPRDMAFCAHAICGREILVVPDAMQDERFRANPLVTGEPKIRFYAGAPLTTDAGHAIGTLCAIDRVPRNLTPQQLSALRILSRQVIMQLELRRSVRRIQQTAKQLQSANESKDRLFSILSHDLRSPFNGLLGLTELLAINAGCVPPDELRDLAAKLHRTAEYTLKMVDDLLQWCMLERNAVPCEPLELSLDDAVADTLEGLYDTAISKSISLRTRCEPRARVLADPTMLRSMIRNLASNALKFTPSGGTVDVNVGVQDEQAFLQVRDSGVGMTAEQLTAVFSEGMNASTRGTAGEPGTGLGLMLCQQFARKTGATIAADSSPGAGTTITVTMPCIA